MFLDKAKIDIVSKKQCIFALVMNKALISIGSNVDADVNLSSCRDLLNQHYEDLVYTDTSVTAPYGKVYKNNFVNQLAVIYTEKDKVEVSGELKLFEKLLGRHVDDKTTGMVVIDIDLVVWNDEVLKPEDMKRSYVADLLHHLRDERF